MASITEGVGVLVATVSVLVRDAIAVCVSRLISYALEEVATLGLATPVVVEQVTTFVAAWAARIARWLRALIASLRRLVPMIRRLGGLIEEIKKIFSRLTKRSLEEHGPPHEPARPPRDRHAQDFTTPEIDSRKITDYAMNPEHPVGKNKYRVIHSATGLGPGDAADIERQIRDGVRSGTPVLGKADQYGQRMECRRANHWTEWDDDRSDSLDRRRDIAHPTTGNHLLPAEVGMCGTPRCCETGPGPA